MISSRKDDGYSPRLTSLAQPFKAIALFAAIFFLTVFAVTPFTMTVSASDASPKITAITTIYPFVEVIANIGGPSVHVTALLPPGASPHTYEPRPGDVRTVAQASLFVTVGAGLDDWATGIKQSAEKELVHIVVSDTVLASGMALDFNEELILGDDHGHDHHHHDVDPHMWLDPIIMRDSVAPEVAAQLKRLLPDESEAIDERLRAYQEDLTELDLWIANQLQNVEKRAFISFHDAWSYLAKRYDLQHMASITPFPGQEPSVRWLVELIRLTRSHDIDVIFAEPQLNPRAAQTIAQEIGGQVVVMDPIGGESLPGRDGYIQLMQTITLTLKDALGG